MKVSFLIFAISVVLTITIFGQEYTDNEIIELVNNQALKMDQSNSNISRVEQIGFENSLYSYQEYTVYVPNFLTSNQNGNFNNAYISQNGINHITWLTQEGNHNEANSWSIGNSTFSFILQKGNYNLINSYISNTTFLPKGASLQQLGDNNRIDFALLGNGFWNEAWPRAAFIKQTGNDLEINAVFDSYQSPLYIEQQSGVNGGMKIDVSTSTFYFPMKNN